VWGTGGAPCCLSGEMNVAKGVGPRHDDDVGPVALGERFEFVHVHVNHRPDGQLAGQAAGAL
jgi:hypothetical protein